MIWPQNVRKKYFVKFLTPTWTWKCTPPIMQITACTRQIFLSKIKLLQTRQTMDNRRDWIGNLLTRPSQPGGSLWRHKNAIFGGRPLFVFHNGKVIVQKQLSDSFGFLFAKADAYICIGFRDICLLLTGSKSYVERFSWRHLAMAGGTHSRY